MRKRLLSALLAMAMMLTMLPTAAFAAEGDEKVAPEVEAYGFVWEAQQPEADLGSGYKAGSDWMGETMWVALKEGSTVGQNLWFEVTVDSDVWGCAATTSDKNMFAFSFLNRTTQWEQAPQNITVGEGQAHAEKYLADKNVAKATLRVYVTESLFTSENHTLPQDATPIFEEEVAITKGQNTLEVVTPEEPEVSGKVVPTVIGTFGTEDKVYTDGSYKVTEGQAVDGVIPVAIAIEGLKEHENANKKMGHWVGFAVTAPEGATKVKYAFSEKAFDANTVLTEMDLEENVDGKGAKGIAFYADAKATAPNVYARVEWVKGNVGMGEAKTYKMDLTNVKVEGEDTEEPPVEPEVKPELLKAGFNMDQKGAAEGINAILKSIQAQGEDRKVQESDLDPDTMYIGVKGLDIKNKDYVLTVKKEGVTTPVYTSKEGDLPVKGEDSRDNAVVYFSLNKAVIDANDQNHSFGTAPISEGKYIFELTEKGQTTVVATSELEICKVTFNKGGDNVEGTAPADMFAAKNAAITLPDGTGMTKTGYTFQGWGVALNESSKYVVTKSETLTALWKNDNVEKAPAESTVTGVADETVKEALEAEGALAADAAPMLSDTAAVNAANTLADTLDANKDKYLAEANKDLADAEKFDGVKVIVYMQIDVTGYQAPVEGDQPKEASLKLNVTPKVAVVATKGEGEQKPTKIVSSTAKPVAETTKPVVIKVKLPTGFPTTDLYAKHYESNGTTVKEWLKVNVDNGVAEFTASSFSPFELVQDSRKVNVNFEGYIAAQDYTPTDIDKTKLPTVEAPDKKEFKGWAVKDDEKETIVIAANATVWTEKILDDLIKLADNKPLVLVAVFGDKSTTPSIPGGIGGGSSGSATYSVNVPTAEHGTVTVNPRNAAKDATVTITVAPDKGYHLESLTVTDKDGNKIELTKVDATKYTFKMPASRVEVKAVFAEGEAPAISFTDVAEGEYYYDAVLWAVNKGITNGLTDTTFGPNASCTRAQMVTFLWRAAGSPEPTSTTTAFTDIDSNEYYYKAVLWAVEKGITTGTTETTFSPSATVTRAQTVTFLYRYAGTPAVSGNNNFTDLEAGEYYVDAVQWAATNGITTGTTETTFSPANNCTRGQIVTFLYRHIVK